MKLSMPSLCSLIRGMIIFATLTTLICPPVLASGHKFVYKFHQGDSWEMVQLSETKMDVMGQKSVQRSRRTILYKVSKDLGKSWYKIAAQVVKQKNWNNGQSDDNNPLHGMKFSAEIHNSGALRKYKFSGGDKTMAAYIGPAMKIAIFFFPEFPDYALESGDDFDVVSSYEMPGMMGGGSMKTSIKINFTLEDISDGLAEFSSQQKIKQQGSGMDIKTAGRSTDLFDLQEGMWFEYETKAKSKMGGGFASGSEMLTITKTTLEKR